MQAVKILAVEGSLDQSQKNFIETWKHKPLIVSQYEPDVLYFSQRGFISLAASTANHSVLYAALRQVIDSSNIEEDKQVSPELDAVRFMRLQSNLYNRTAPTEEGIEERVNGKLSPTRVLLNKRLGSIPALPREGTTHTSQVQDSRELDRLTHLSSAPSSVFSTRREFERLVDRQDPGSLPAAFRQLPIKPTMAARDGLLILAPCIDEAAFLAGLNPTINHRISSVFYPAWDGDQPPARKKLVLQEQAVQDELLNHWQQVDNFIRASTAIFASDENIATIVLPKLASSFFRLYSEIRTLYFQGALRSLNRKLESFGDLLSKSIGEEITDYLSTVVTGIRVISDLPIEWLRIGNAPLGLRTKVSRLPLTPANSLLLYASQLRWPLNIDQKAATKVLVANCLPQTDPIREDVASFQRALKMDNLECQYVDIASQEDYAAALNREEPYILIHIGHGRYRKDGCVNFQTGEQWMELTSLAEPTAIPAIVLFAACDSMPVFSSAVGARAYLAFGCRAVTATLLPVEAKQTLGFYHLVLTFLHELLKGTTRKTTWGDVLMNAQIRNEWNDYFYSFNLYRQQRSQTLISPETMALTTEKWEAIYQRENAIEPNSDFGRTSELIQAAIEERQPELTQQFAAFVSEGRVVKTSMFFTHLGSPETINIRPGTQRT